MLLDQPLRISAKVVPVVAAVLAVLRITGRNPPAVLVRAVAWLTPLTLALLAFSVINSTQDFDAFYYSGRDVLAGRDPYANVIPAGKTYRMPALNPPTAFPLFVAF